MTKKWWYSLGVFIFLFFVVCAVYFLNIDNTFILDDYVWIQGLNWEQVRNLFVGTWEHGNTLRPIMRLQFFSSRLLFGENPVGWHLVNFFLHALVAWCGYKIIFSITGKNRLAILGATLFAIFPGNHEVVAWVSGRTHPCGLLLSLAAGYLLFRGFQASSRQICYMVGGYFVLLMAFLTYEVSFVVPFALLFYVLIFGQFNRRTFGVIGGAMITLIGLIIYRYFVLGGSVGAVAVRYDNVFMAPFYNFSQLKTLFFYSREIKIIVALVLVSLLYVFVKNKVWLKKDKDLLFVYWFLILSALAYGPFATTKGVAPRFLYSALFFFIIAVILLYKYLEPVMSKYLRYFIYLLVGLVFIFSIYRTWQVSARYQEVAHAYDLIIAQVIKDFPVWPDGQDMLFYGIPNGNQNILAFLTYFPTVIKRQYQLVGGEVLRAEKLPKEQYDNILAKNPIIYQFIDFSVGVKRVINKIPN